MVLMINRRFMLSILVATLATARGCHRDDSVVIRSKDGQSEMTLPAGWSQLQRDSALSQLMASNPSTHEYVDLITESHEDIGLALKEYAEHRRDATVANLNDAAGSNVQLINVRGIPAARYEVIGTTKKNGVKIGYVVTILDTTKNFHQVVAWTTQSRFQHDKTDLALLADGLREIRSTPAAAKAK